MRNESKIIIGLLSLLVIMVGFSFLGGGGGIGAYDESFTNFTKLKATDAFIAEGTFAAQGSVTTGSISATQTSTTTIAVGNTGVGKLCLWNGASYTLLSFASNATTTSIATSTACQ